MQILQPWHPLLLLITFCYAGFLVYNSSLNHFFFPSTTSTTFPKQQFCWSSCKHYLRKGMMSRYPPVQNWTSHYPCEVSTGGKIKTKVLVTIALTEVGTTEHWIASLCLLLYFGRLVSLWSWEIMGHSRRKWPLCTLTWILGPEWCLVQEYVILVSFHLLCRRSASAIEETKPGFDIVMKQRSRKSTKKVRLNYMSFCALVACRQN